jgi:hypothetical protein
MEQSPHVACVSAGIGPGRSSAIHDDAIGGRVAELLTGWLRMTGESSILVSIAGLSNNGQNNKVACGKVA